MDYRAFMDEIGENSTLDKVRQRLGDLYRYFRKSRNRGLLVLAVTLFVLPITILLAQRIVRNFSRAASATLSFQSASTNLPPNQVVSVMVNSGTTSVGFARVVVNFDITKVKLASEVTTSASLTMNNLDAENDPNYVAPADACQGTSPCIIKTPMVAANNSGRVVIVLAKDPRNTANPPSGVF